MGQTSSMVRLEAVVNLLTQANDPFLLRLTHCDSTFCSNYKTIMEGFTQEDLIKLIDTHHFDTEKEFNDEAFFNQILSHSEQQLEPRGND